MNIGDKLTNLRINSGKTLKEQSEALKVSPYSIHRWERGVLTPGKSMAEKLPGNKRHRALGYIESMNQKIKRDNFFVIYIVNHLKMWYNNR